MRLEACLMGTCETGQAVLHFNASPLISLLRPTLFRPDRDNPEKFISSSRGFSHPAGKKSLQLRQEAENFNQSAVLGTERLYTRQNSTLLLESFLVPRILVVLFIKYDSRSTEVTLNFQPKHTACQLNPPRWWDEEFYQAVLIIIGRSRSRLHRTNGDGQKE